LLTGDYRNTWSELSAHFENQASKISNAWMDAWSEAGDTSFSLLDWRKSFHGTFRLNHGDNITSKISCVGGEDTVMITQRLSPLIAKPLAEYPGVSKMLNHTILERNFVDGADGNYIAEKNHVLYFGASPSDLWTLLSDSSDLESSIVNSWEEACDQAFAWYYSSNGQLPDRLKDFGRYYFATHRVSAHMRLEDDRPYLKLFLHDHLISEEKDEAVSTEPETCFDVTCYADGSMEKLCIHDGIAERFDQHSKPLFKVEVEGNAMGKVSEVDALQNGKWQAAFTTRKKLYVIEY